MSRYAVHLAPDPSGGFVVTLPDFPEAVTQGESVEDAMEQAIDCLDEAVAARINDREPIPVPSVQGDLYVEPSFDIAAKAAIYAAVREQKLTISALARRLEVGETEVRRLLDPYHQTRPARLDKVARKLGKRLRVELVDMHSTGAV